MKKVYIPTQEELDDMKKMMQTPDYMIYQYLMAKTIETLIMEDIIYEEIDMFEVAYKQFLDYPEIKYGLAKLYPEKISTSKYASQDSNLCSKLVLDWTSNHYINEKNHPIENLDNLTLFDDNVLQNPKVIESTIYALATNLHKYPKYRFTYQEPNALLDTIFSGEILEGCLRVGQIKAGLSNIDPIYNITIRQILQSRIQNQIHIESLFENQDKQEISDSSKKIFYSDCGRFIRKYITEIYNPHRKGEEYPVQNLDRRTKKLVRYLHNHKKNCQI